MGARIAIVVVAAALIGCTADEAPLDCSRVGNAYCNEESGGTCMPSPSGGDFCAYASASCASGLTWGASSGVLAGQCVTTGGPDGGGVIDGGQAKDAGPRPDAAPSAADAGVGPPDAGPAVLTVDPSAHDYGALAPGQTVSQDFLVTNTGGSPTGAVVLTVGGTDASAFTLDEGSCHGATLGPLESCALTVTFATTTQPTKTATLDISASPGGVLMVDLSGKGLAPASLGAAPTSLTFPAVTTGASTSLPVTIKNNGAVATATLATSISGSDGSSFMATSDTCDGTSLPAGASCSVTVIFAPVAAGQKSASLAVGDGAKTATVPLAGLGQLPGALSASPSTTTFATTGLGGTATATVTVKNTGGAPVSSLATSISGANAADFSRMTDGCNGKTLAGGASCTVTVAFKPSAPGNRAATLSVTGSSSASTASSLAGTGTAHLTVVVDQTYCAGTVASADHVIDCGPTCEADLATSSILLTAHPGTRLGAACYLDKWSLSACGTSGACTVDLSTSQTLTVSFSPRYCVATTGSDAGRGSCSAPFKTVTHAMSVAASGDLVQLLPGTYTENTTGETFPITVPAGVSLIGDEATRGNAAVPTYVFTSNTNPDPSEAGVDTFEMGSGTTIAGLRLAGSGGVVNIVSATGFVARHNTIMGIGPHAVGIGANSSTGIFIDQNDINNIGFGIVLGNGASAKVQRNTIRMALGFGIAVQSANSADLGGGTTGSVGGNVLSCNGYADLFVFQSIVRAQNNFWDHIPPTTCSALSCADIDLAAGTSAPDTSGAQLATNPCP